MRPLLHQGKAKPVARGEIIYPKKFSASTEDFYSKLCVLKFCSLASVDAASKLCCQFPIEQRILYSIGWYQLMRSIYLSIYTHIYIYVCIHNILMYNMHCYILQNLRKERHLRKK